MRPNSRTSKPFNKNKKIKKASYSAEFIAGLNYKSPSQLRRFISERGKILSRRHTGLTAAQQRTVAEHIKRARFMSLLHYTADQVR